MFCPFSSPRLATPQTPPLPLSNGIRNPILKKNAILYHTLYFMSRRALPRKKLKIIRIIQDKATSGLPTPYKDPIIWNPSKSSGPGDNR